jgi:hypothetical protein
MKTNPVQDGDIEYVRKQLAEIKALRDDGRNQARIDFWQSRLDFLLQTERRSSGRGCDRTTR